VGREPTIEETDVDGFNLAYSGASAGIDVPNIELVELNCGCFASVQETNHGGALDSFQLNYDGNVSAPIVNVVPAIGGEAASARRETSLRPSRR
jgi:hypothetical protein